MDIENLKQAFERLKQSNFSERVYIEPAIPEKQLKKATSAMRVPDGSNVLVLFDNTWTKSGKGGICFTRDAIYWKEIFGRGSIKFEDIKYIDIKFGLTKNLKINTKEISIDTLSKEEVQPLVDFLKEVSGPKEAKAEVKEDVKEERIKEKKVIPFKRWGKGGICDVCNVDLGSGAYMVPVGVFYGSKKYKDWLVTGPMGVLVEMAGGANAFLANTKSKDQTTHSIVCSSCVRLFM